MKLREILRFELVYGARRPWFWLIFGALLVFSFLMTRDASLAEALHDDFFVNSPFAVAKTTVMGGLIWLLVAAAIAGEAAARDVATGMHPLVYTLPIGKTALLGGRFLAAFLLNALLLLAVQAGILVALYTPGVDAAALGPFRPAAHLTAYGFLALPNAFVATAVQFALAARAGRPMAGYLGSLVLFFSSYVVATFLLFQGRGDLTALLDVIGVHYVLSDLSHLWTPAEKSWRLLALEGRVLANRLLWLGIGAGALGLGWWRFRLTHRTAGSLLDSLRSLRPGRWAGRRRRAAGPAPAAPAVAVAALAPIPPVARTFGAALHARQTLAVARESFRAIARSPAGLALLVLVPLLAVPVVIDQMELDGVPLTPTTARVLAELTAPLTAEMSRWVIVPLLLVLFAGELVWRERDAGLGEIAGALPGSEWPRLLGKLLGLALVLVAFLALLGGAGMLAQTVLGHRDLEIGLYAKVLLGLQLPEYLLFALLALVVHVVVDHKYVGHLAALMAYVFLLASPLFGVEHDLLVYGAAPGWSTTDMRGFGPTLAPWLWFEAYWGAWAVLLAVAARLLWVRGSERGVRPRLRLVRGRLTRPTVWTAAVAAALVLGIGGAIFHETNVRHEYLSAGEAAGRRAEYERRYGRYANAPQPRLAATRLHVEIHPERREVDIRGSYRLVNRETAPIRTLHVATVPGVETGAFALDRTAALVTRDELHGHRIYELRAPLRPGESLQLDFTVRLAPRGFRESGADVSVVANGTYFTSRECLPAIGYRRERELTGAAERRAQGLAARPPIPPLDDPRARRERRDTTTFAAVLGTSADQVAVAPGALRRTWTEGGRRYAHYATDAPIGDEYAIASARYAIRVDRWSDPERPAAAPVDIRIFHHPAHTAHLDRMVRSLRASLDVYTRRFGPYRYGHLTVVEHPGNGTGMHAEASLITHEEGFAHWRPRDEPGSLDLPFAIVAHEMAHQWTVPYAVVEGAPVMSESVAWYYGMKVVEQAGGRAALRRLLAFMRQPYPYPPIRRGEPLLRGLDPYLAYRKGPFALHALSEYVGEERVDAALRRLLETHRSAGAPPATTRDLYRELQAVTPAALRPLLRDLFELTTTWELATERAVAAPTADGAWRVTMEVRARKTTTDPAGVETEVPMDDPIQIGVFAPVEGGDGLDAPLHLVAHRIRSGRQTIAVTVPQRPALAGIDPHHLLEVSEPESDDNLARVEAVDPAAQAPAGSTPGPGPG